MSDKTLSSLENVLGGDDIALMMQLEDSLMDKSGWGEFLHPIVVLRRLRRFIGTKYGGNWAEWDPETLIKYIELELGEASALTKQKIFALQTCLVTDAPWNMYDVFENVCLTFSNRPFMWGVTEPLELPEVAFGVGVLDAIRDEEWDDDVLGYIAATLLRNGLICLPKQIPLPDVDHIIRRQLNDFQTELAKEFKDQWNQGARSDDISGDDPLMVQLAKLQILDEFYHAGRYVALDRGKKNEQI